MEYKMQKYQKEEAKLPKERKRVTKTEKKTVTSFAKLRRKLRAKIFGNLIKFKTR